MVDMATQQVELARQQYNQQIDQSMDTNAADLNRALADAQGQFQTQQNQIAANEMNALDNAALYDRKVTDELLRLYGLSNDYSFQPPTNKPKSYVDPKDKSKEYVLTEEQQMAYVRLSREVYNDAVLTIITDPSYARLTDAKKAERLNAMRSSLAAEVKDRFLLWLSQNTTSTDREEDKVSKETKRYIKALLGW